MEGATNIDPGLPTAISRKAALVLLCLKPTRKSDRKEDQGAINLGSKKNQRTINPESRGDQRRIKGRSTRNQESTLHQRRIKGRINPDPILREERITIDAKTNRPPDQTDPDPAPKSEPGPESSTPEADQSPVGPPGPALPTDLELMPRQPFDLDLLDALARELGYKRVSRRVQNRTLTFLQYLNRRYQRR